MGMLMGVGVAFFPVLPSRGSSERFGRSVFGGSGGAPCPQLLPAVLSLLVGPGAGVGRLVPQNLGEAGASASPTLSCPWPPHRRVGCPLQEKPGGITVAASVARFLRTVSYSQVAALMGLQAPWDCEGFRLRLWLPSVSCY